MTITVVITFLLLEMRLIISKFCQPITKIMGKNLKKINLTINGQAKQVVADENMVLLDLLREHLYLTGAKQSCDRKGQCGACTVIVNKKAVLSCLTKVHKLEGATVISVEGLGTPANPHLIQEAFALAGAIQCGFCTPGMIMATKALLDVNLDPSVGEIKYAFAAIFAAARAM